MGQQAFSLVVKTPGFKALLVQRPGEVWKAQAIEVPAACLGEPDGVSGSSQLQPGPTLPQLHRTVCTYWKQRLSGKGTSARSMFQALPRVAVLV